MKAQKKQERNVLQWQQEQNRARIAEQARQEDLRKQADAAREQGLQQIGADAQQKRQSEEEARLAAYLKGDEGKSQEMTPQADIPTSVADPRLAGQQDTGDPGDKNFQGDLARKINEATQGAKQRLGALARVSSYGESFGGLGTTNPLIQQETGQNIDKFNEFRRGSMAAYGLEKAIDPVQVTYQPSPLGDILGAAASLGSNYLGGKMAQGGLGIGAGAKTVADPWGGLRFPTLPKVAPVPTSRPTTF